MFIATATQAVVPTWLIAPVAVLLLAIALGPIALPHFWHRRYPLVAVTLGAISAVCYHAVTGEFAPLLRTLGTYASWKTHEGLQPDPFEVVS